MTSEIPVSKVSNYKGNSKIDREVAAEPVKAEPKIKPIVGVNVIQTKKSIGQRIKNSFGGQDLKSVGLHLLTAVILPKSQDMLMMLIEEGGHRVIYGETRRSAPTTIASSIVGSSRIRTTNYNSISSGSSPLIGGNRPVIETSLNSQERAMFDFSNLVLGDHEKALEVLERMRDAIEEYGVVSVGDFYDVLQISGNGFTDQKFGWDARAFARADVKRVREGWILDIPRPLGIA